MFFSRKTRPFSVFITVLLAIGLILPARATIGELNVPPPKPPKPSPTYELVILHGTVIDPATEQTLEHCNLGISQGKIVRITREEIHGRASIDAAGLVVAPGFIDLISYEPNEVGIKLKIQDGVTSNLLMHGGTDNAKAWYARLARNGCRINYGASSFTIKMRAKIIGGNRYRVMTDPKQIAREADMVRQNLREGALGVSFSPEYFPGVRGPEILPLLRVAKEFNAPAFYHTRYSDNQAPGTNLEGVDEVIGYARQTGVATHIMHINSTGGTRVMDQALDRIAKARAEGLDVTSCLYPYTSWATYLASARFDTGWQQRFSLNYQDLQLGGTHETLTPATFKKYRRNPNILVVANNSMPESDLLRALSDRTVMIGSDTIIEPRSNNHPRGSGTYARLLGYYSRERKALTLVEALRKVSYLPAVRMQTIAPAMRLKGRIALGADADLTLFNPNTILDRATVEKPVIPSIGVQYVLVGGTLVKTPAGLVASARPGKPVRSWCVDPAPKRISSPLTIQVNNTVYGNIDRLSVQDLPWIPLDDLASRLGSKLSTDSKGTLTLTGLFSVRLGERSGHAANQVLSLENEPVPMEGRFWISLADAERLLGTAGKVSLNQNTLIFEPIIEEPAQTESLLGSLLE
ncbi:MAG: amidohydrolase family protein [Solirubrobacterales bacterium]